MKIYTLCCEQEPFYVGKTDQELGARLSGHLSESKDGGSPKNEFIRINYHVDGKEITIHILEEVEEYHNQEQIWKEDFERLGIKLYNSRNGDDNTTPAEAAQVKTDIQEQKRKAKQKKPVECTMPPWQGTKEQFDKEVERLSKLYDTDRELFETEYIKHKETINEHKKDTGI